MYKRQIDLLYETKVGILIKKDKNIFLFLQKNYMDIEKREAL